MGDAERVLEAVADGPLPVHVVRQRTGIEGPQILAVLGELKSQGRISRVGEMVDLPGRHPAPVPDTPPTEVMGVIGGPLDEPEVYGGYEPEVYDDPPTTVMEPVDGDGEPASSREQAFLVATSWTQVWGRSAQAVAEIALSETANRATAEVLVIDESNARVYERATVVRAKS